MTDLATCEICGEKALETTERPQEFVYGSGFDAVTLSVVVPVHECLSCEEKYTGAEGEARRQNAIDNHLKQYMRNVD